MDYFKNLQKLLTQEKEEDWQQYNHKIVTTSLHERRKKGWTWFPLLLKGHEIGAGEAIMVYLEKIQHDDAKPVFQVGDTVSFFVQLDNNKTEKIPAVVSKIQYESIRLALNVDDLPDWVDMGRLGVDLVFDDNSYKEMNKAIQKVQEAKGNRLAELRDVLIGEKKAYFKKPEFFNPVPTLNFSQNEALEHILSAQDIAIIHGPPGTGKTTTLVEAIRMALYTEKQVLVVAPSNTAVDLLTERLAQKGLKVLRIGNPARMDESITHLSLESQIAQHTDYRHLRNMRKRADDFRQMAGKYKRNFGAEEREQRKLLYAEAHNIKADAEKLENYILENLLQNAQVITATLVGSVNKYIRNMHFSTIFIDEAAQALEPACWVAIPQADRVIFAGDPFQLPPTVKSNEAMRGGLSKTILEKLLPYKELSTLLQVQYRMHKEIMEFSNQQFYEGKLQASENVANQMLSQHVYLLNESVEFIDTAGCSYEEVQNPQSRSKHNPDEGDLLIRHLSTLLQMIQQEYAHLFTDIFSIGVISPYSAQVDYLQEQLSKNPDTKPYMKWITVQTIDGFQGQECDIVYISLVRSNDKNEIGFLQDTRRLNVALTRARYKLVVIGDSATIGKHKFYSDFLDYAQKFYKSAWEFVG